MKGTWVVWREEWEKGRTEESFTGVLTVFYTPGPLTPGPHIAMPFPGVLHQISSSPSPFHPQLLLSYIPVYNPSYNPFIFIFGCTTRLAGS